jgi:hypothetical protein
MTNDRKGLKLPLGCVIAAGIVTMICQVIFCVSLITPTTPTRTPTLDIEAMKTALALSAQPTPTASVTPIPTQTISITSTLTNTPLPTSTNTAISLPTATIFISILPGNQPTQPPQSAVCSCSSDSLNCGDFTTHSSAQACYNYCVSAGRGDIHSLDGNNDGDACESLN